jgi:poly(A) polymerase
LRLIGDPELRYREDPVRMLRAVRIATKLSFAIEPKAAALIPKLASLLREIPPARLFDEVLKMFLSRDAVANFDGLRRHGLFSHLFTMTDEAVETDPAAADLVRRALANTAHRIEHNMPVAPAFLFGALLWAPYSMRVIQLQREQGHVPIVAQTQAAEEVLASQQLRIAVPKRFSVPMREIWITQSRFENRRSGPAKRLLTHPRFRAAYDFLLLRAQTGEPGLRELADWWTQAQQGTFAPVAEVPVEAVPSVPGAPAKKKRRSAKRWRRAKLIRSAVLTSAWAVISRSLRNRSSRR